MLLFVAPGVNAKEEASVEVKVLFNDASLFDVVSLGVLLFVASGVNAKEDASAEVRVLLDEASVEVTLFDGPDAAPKEKELFEADAEPREDLDSASVKEKVVLLEGASVEERELLDGAVIVLVEGASVVEIELFDGATLGSIELFTCGAETGSLYGVAANSRVGVEGI